MFPARLAMLVLVCGLTSAGIAGAGGSRQPGTGGVTQLEGSAGGGLVPWAVIQGYGAADETGATAFASYLDSGDFELSVRGVAVGVRNRVELSYARQELDLVTLGPNLSQPGASLEQDVFGLKVRLAGSLFYTDWPQLSAGLQYKRNRSFELPATVGARDDSDVDVYLSVARLWLAGVGGLNALANVTLRSSRANELGLLGFGGDRRDDRELLVETSAGLFLARHWLVGVEYRQKPDQLVDLEEDAWWDVFVTWVPHRHLSLTAAWVDLGTVAGLAGQDGLYLSVEGAF